MIFIDGLGGAAQRALIGVNQSVQEDVDTYKVNFEYKFNDDIFLYALASSGYRAGGFNPINPLLGIPPTNYESDTLWNYEVGAKTSWLENRLIANTTIYRVDWSDIQLTEQLIGPNGSATITGNVGKAKIDGVELELDYRATKHLTLGLNLSYMDATIEEDVPTEGTFKGDRLPGSADLSHSLYIDYAQPISDELGLSVRLTQRYIGERLTGLGSGSSVQANNLVSSYDTTDFRASISHTNGLEASLFVNNMFNNISFTWIENMPLYTRWRITQPRVMGLNVGYNF